MPKFAHLTAAALAAVLAMQAIPAEARDRYWRGNEWYDGPGYHHGGHWRRHRDTVVIAPAYDEYYYEERYYAPAPAPVYSSGSRVVCNDSYNPLPMVLGAGAGGLIGSTIGQGSGNAAAIIGGALLGGVLGGQYGYEGQRCVEQVFETGRPVHWQRNNEYYSVEPVREFRDEGRYCREYQTTTNIGGRKQASYGMACQQPDGSWEIVN